MSISVNIIIGCKRAPVRLVSRCCAFFPSLFEQMKMVSVIMSTEILIIVHFKFISCAMVSPWMNSFFPTLPRLWANGCRIVMVHVWNLFLQTCKRWNERTKTKQKHAAKFSHANRVVCWVNCYYWFNSIPFNKRIINYYNELTSWVVQTDLFSRLHKKIGKYKLPFKKNRFFFFGESI